MDLGLELHLNRQWYLRNTCIKLSNLQHEEITDNPVESIDCNYRVRNATKKEVKQLIRSIKTNKTSGYDLRSGKIIKELPDKAVRIIFNAVFGLKYFPSTRKMAQIILLPKPKRSVREPSSQKSISLIPTLLKNLEKVVLIRLKEIIVKKTTNPKSTVWFYRKSCYHRTNPRNTRGKS